MTPRHGNRETRDRAMPSHFTGLQSDTMSDKTLTCYANGNQIALSNFDGALNKNDVLVGAPAFIASKLGVTGYVKGMKNAEVKALAKSQGHTDEDIKLANRAYDEQRNSYWKQSRQIAGLLVADPTFRTSAKRTKTGVTVAFRKIKEATARKGNAARIAQLEAMLAAAGLQIPA